MSIISVAAATQTPFFGDHLYDPVGHRVNAQNAVEPSAGFDSHLSEVERNRDIREILTRPNNGPTNSLPEAVGAAIASGRLQRSDDEPLLEPSMIDEMVSQVFEYLRENAHASMIIVCILRVRVLTSSRSSVNKRKTLCWTHSTTQHPHQPRNNSSLFPNRRKRRTRRCRRRSD